VGGDKGVEFTRVTVSKNTKMNERTTGVGGEMVERKGKL